MRLGRISIFHEESDNPRAPVLKGTITYENGVTSRVSLWREEHPGVNGGEYFSGSIEEDIKKRRSGTMQNENAPTSAKEGTLKEDDIPF